MDFGSLSMGSVPTYRSNADWILSVHARFLEKQRRNSVDDILSHGQHDGEALFRRSGDSLGTCRVKVLKVSPIKGGSYRQRSKTLGS